MARRFEGRGAIEVDVQETGVIWVSQEEAGGEMIVIEILPQDLDILIPALREAALEATEKIRG